MITCANEFGGVFVCNFKSDYLDSILLIEDDEVCKSQPAKQVINERFSIELVFCEKKLAVSTLKLSSNMFVKKILKNVTGISLIRQTIVFFN